MQIFEKTLSEIHPYSRNPRKNDEAVGPVAESIRQFGFKVPIVVDSNGVIVAGHTRYKAAKMLGLQTVPVIIADDLTPEQIKAFRLADNKVGELAEWDTDLLGEELADILDIDMTAFGFEIEMEEPDEVVEDEPPEPPENPVARPGDVWQLGEHRLICGDSTDPSVIEKLVGGGTGGLPHHRPAVQRQLPSQGR